jgi:hypothetical protein
MKLKETNEMTNFLDTVHRLSSIKDTRRFGDWNLSPSSGKNDTYSVGPERDSQSVSPDKRCGQVMEYKEEKDNI